MKEIMHDLLKSTLVGIGVAMSIFCLVGIVFDVSHNGNFNIENYYFTKMVVGCIIIGLGFGLPTVVYQRDNLPMPIRVLIHMGIGCVVYTIVAYALGWIGGAVGIRQGVFIAIIQIAVAFLIWFLFMRHYSTEAKKMNERIQAMK